MSQEIERLKYKIKGIRAVILIKGNEIVFSEFEKVKTKYLFNSIYYLVKEIREAHDLKGMMITGQKGGFFIFSYKKSCLGVLSEPDTNLPLLELLIRRYLPLQEEEEMRKDVEEAGKAEPEKEIPFFLRVSCSDYFKRLPEEYKKDKNE